MGHNEQKEHKQQKGLNISRDISINRNSSNVPATEEIQDTVGKSTTSGNAATAGVLSKVKKPTTAGISFTSGVTAAWTPATTGLT